MIDQAGAEVVIIDPLSSYHGQPNESDNAMMRQSLDQLTILCDRVRCTPIVVHHAGKAGTDNEVFGGRGASSIGDWAANILLLDKHKRDKGELLIKVTHQKARNFETVPDFYLRRTKELQFHLEDLVSHKKQEIEAVVNILKQVGGSCEGQNNFTSLIAANQGWSQGKCKAVIKAAVQAKMIQEVKEKHLYIYKLS